MDANSKKKVPQNTITRDIKNLAAPTGNIYESVVILYKRANQIAAAEKKELTKKLEDFRNDRDTMEEVFENKEQIEISKYYERQPKPDLVAIAEFCTTAGRRARTRSTSTASNAPLPPRLQLRTHRLSGN